jgi:hypothetical protein
MGEAYDERASGLPVLAPPDPEQELLEVVRRLQLALLVHPAAAQALFSALITEGREYARTSDGAQWLGRLTESRLLRRARVLWDVSTMKMLEEDPSRVLPSTYVESFARAARVQPIEPLLRALFDAGEADA